MDGYPCGCFSERENGRACKDARELYQKAQEVYWQAHRTGAREAWDEYARLFTQYLNHFEEQREVAEVG